MIPFRCPMIVFWLFLLPGITTANISGVKNFPKTVYNAANQNWSVDVEAATGYIYFANHKGLLEFDGANWKLMPLPGHSITRAVFVDSDSTIYTAGYRELGYWKRAATNKDLKYTSLNSLAEPYFSKNDEFWKIVRHNQSIYFQSFGKILAYSGQSVTPVEFPGFIHTMEKVGSRIIVAVRETGLFSIENGQPVPFLIDPVFRETIVKFILALSETKMLIGTSNKGVFTWDGKHLKQWNQAWTNYFVNNEVNRGHICRMGNIIIGTITDGITVFNTEGKLISHYNTGNGLQNNTVLGISSDGFGNIWLALDNGIGFISADVGYNIDIQSVKNAGSVYDLALFEGRLYLGTNQGLFYRYVSGGDDNLYSIPEAQGQVWFCRQIGDRLFVGYNGGTLSIKNSVATKISDQAGGFCIKEDPLKAGNLVVSTYNNLVIIKAGATGYLQQRIIQGFYDLIRYIEFDHRGNLWASHMHRGVYQLQFNSTRDSIINIRYHGLNSPFKKDHSVHVFKVENRIVFTTGDSLFTYNDINDSIVPYTWLNQQTKKFSRAIRIISGPDHHYWFITRDDIGLFRILNHNVELINFIPRWYFSQNNLIDDFENLYPTSATSAIICLENGIATIELEKIKPSKITQFKPAIREITLSGFNESGIQALIQNGVVNINSRFHNVRVRYSFPHFTHHTIHYKYKIEGIDSEWSESITEPVFSFDRLPVGTYRLLVKAVDAWENESQQESITLKVMPPFYWSSWAKKIYFLLAILLFFGLQKWSIRKTRLRARLKIEKREQELTRLRNEKLSNEVEHKCKELANLTMANIKKNEFLMKLKEILNQQKEHLGSRFPDKYFHHITGKIDENISSSDDWNLFETNFERAHEQFLQKLKDEYPELTPKDLRLCAFLRLNLSSKEIAPLMGISVRGVENHRYKLRKKMGLNHDENLIEIILKR